MNSKKLRNRKIFILVFLIICTSLVATFLPSLARVKNRTALETLTVWDGTTATSYRKGTGTKDDPYQIATGNELSYFSSMLKTTSYEGKYFTLSNDILLNNGIFSYEDGVTYTLNKSKFYLKDFTGDFYDNKEATGVKIGSINLMKPLENFKGHFDGDFHTIYGLYISSTEEEVGLFTNLQGEVNNLYVSNALIRGGNITGGIASRATDSKLYNITYSGHIIGNSEAKRKDENFNLENKYITENETSTTIDISNTIKNIEGTIIEKTLSGTCSNNFTANENEVLCTNNTFTIELENDFSLEIKAEETLDLTDLNLEITYDVGIAGGILGLTDNVILENTINKSDVKSSLVSGGLIGLGKTKLNIERSYNTSNIEGSLFGAGLVGEIKSLNDTSNIRLSYNSGSSNSLIGSINGASNLLTLESSFDANGTGQIIGIADNSIVNLNGVYTVGDTSIDEEKISGRVNNISLTELKNIDTMTSLGFNSFIDPEDNQINKNNAWIYEEGYLPSLYIDDLQNPIATLNVSTYSWNNLGFDSNRINFAKSIAFSINEITSVRPIKEAYYYLSKKGEPLSKEEIENINDWTPYESITPLTEEGIYCIYVKIIDFNDRTSYLNSDILVIDTTGSDVTISNSDKNWNTLNNTPDYVFIDEENTFKVDANDQLSGVKSIEYHVASSKIEEDSLGSIDWLTYNESINITYLGTHIIYVKVTDNSGNITIVNSDYIVYTGFSLDSLQVGNEIVDTPLVNVTDRSNITYNFTYKDTISYKEGDKHYLVTNSALPIGTKITIKDNNKNKVYTYTVDKNETTYPFESFREVGKANMHVMFTEEYKEQIDDNYSIKIDFEDTIFENDIENLTVYIETKDKDAKTTRSTVKRSLKSINIYKNQYAKTSITSSYGDNSIIYNSDSIETVELTTKLEYAAFSGSKIFDSQFKDKNLGIRIKFVDANGIPVAKEHMKNIQFKLENEYYSPDSDGITRIQVQNGVEDAISNLMIITSKTKTTLSNGTYYFKIDSYAAYDGLYSKETSETEVSIPVIVEGEYIDTSYSFDIKTDADYRVLFKSDNIAKLNYNIIQKGEYNSPNIRVSLYKKDKLTAYDQSYSLIDLKEYSNTELEKVLDSVYYASKSPSFGAYNQFSLDLDLTKFKSGGYKFVFELYSGNKRIGTLERKFIVR